MAPNLSTDSFEIEEFDQADNLVATYVRRLSGTAGGRIDVVVIFCYNFVIESS